MPVLRRGARRLIIAAGAVLAIGALTTAAAFVDLADVRVALDGTRTTFDIRTAGSDATGWEPSPSD